SSRGRSRRSWKASDSPPARCWITCAGRESRMRRRHGSVVRTRGWAFGSSSTASTERSRRDNVVQETAHAALGEWESFYIIVGSSAAALTGLQFVVITLVSEARRGAGSAQIAAFSTPTIVHSCAALLVSATLSAQWPDLLGPAIVIATCGLVGVLYTAVVVVRARRQTGYTLVAEDWTWHVVLPLIAYLGQGIAGLVLRRATHG